LDVIRSKASVPEQDGLVLMFMLVLGGARTDSRSGYRLSWSSAL